MAVVEIGRPYVIRERDYACYLQLIGDELVLVPKTITATFVFCDVYWKGSAFPFEPYRRDERFYSYQIKPVELPAEDVLTKWLFVAGGLAVDATVPMVVSQVVILCE